MDEMFETTMMDFEIFLKQQENAMEIIKYVEKKVKEKEMDEVMTKSMLCLLFDVLFGKDSVEVAKEVCTQVEKVNEELGTL